MTEYEQIEVEREGRVQIIRFNRPDQLNALSPTLSREFVEAIERANGDPEIGAIVSTGNGRAYCAGAEFAGPGPNWGVCRRKGASPAAGRRVN